MNQLSTLRKFSEHQQFPELLKAAQKYWHETRDISALPLLALAHAHQGQKKTAIETLDKAFVRKVDFDSDANVDLAAALVVMHRIEEAIDILEAVLEEQPDHALALSRRGYCHGLLGEFDMAEKLYRRSIDLDPHRILVINNLAHMLLLQTNCEAAQRVFMTVMETLDQIQSDLPGKVHQQYQKMLALMQLQIWTTAEKFSEAESWLAEQKRELQKGAEETFIDQVLQYARFLAENDHHLQAQEILKDYYKQYPDSTALCLQLAELAQLQGQFRTAVKLLSKALKQDGDNSALWVQLSSVSLNRFTSKARHAAEKAVELTEALCESDEVPLPLLMMKRASAKNALAQVESQEQNFDVSENLFKEILDDHEFFLPALQGLGQQYMQQGKLDDALELFERIKKIDPIKGISSLINARKFPEDEATLAHMEMAAKTPSLEGRIKAGILFQLAAAWEKRKDYSKAFEFAEKANSTSKKFLPYDGKKHRNHLARIRTCFSKSLYEHRKNFGVESSLPVYVLGMPRSGTTLVEQILSGHSKMFGAGELGIIPQVSQGLNRWERHTGSSRAYPDCIDDLDPVATQGIANNVLNELQEFEPEALHIIDKMPHNFENIGLIKFLFPNARIISIRRDPRDIAISNYFTDYQAKHGGMGFAYDLTDIGEQLADHNLLMHHWHETFPNEILELNYEDVVDDLEGSTRKMLDYIGVEWEPQVLKFNELERTVKTASVWQVRQPIYKTSKAKWENYKDHLAPLIKGTNAKIISDPITDMITLPEPAFLTDGVELYRAGDLDGAETCFKKMLHHNPDHAACNYMLGLVYMRKNHPRDGIKQMENALEKAPWHKEWRENLSKAYGIVGEKEKAAELNAKYKRRTAEINITSEEDSELHETPEAHSEMTFPSAQIDYTNISR